MEKEVISLPLIVGGQETDGDSRFQLEYDDLIIQFPVLNDETRKAVISMDQDGIHNLKLWQIIGFLQKVSELWHDKEYPLRKKLMEYGPRISGLSPEMYQYNLYLLLNFICSKALMHDVVDMELGDGRLLDEWISRQHGEIHAEPLGNLLHIISGNVPMVGFYSVIKGLLAKNVNIVKLSKKDFLSSYYFIRSFADVDPNHPVTKAVSAVYWDKDDLQNMECFCNAADGMVVWGGLDTIKAYKTRCPIGCEFLEYGPKKGIQIIDYDNTNDDQLELKVARDISVFDQEACLSPQLILLKGDVQKFRSRLGSGLSSYAAFWPEAKHSDDHYIQLNYLIAAHRYLGNWAVAAPDRSCAIVDLADTTPLHLDHPLGRTVFIKQIQDFDECLDYIDGNVQTVGIAPVSLARELRDKLTRRGVSRIANIGNVDMPREGLVHEGIGLNRLVRIVGMEKEEQYFSKVYDLSDDYFKGYPIGLRWKQKKGEQNG